MLTKNEKYISPYLFFLLENGQIIAWDYKNHQQFSLEKKYFERLLELSHSERIPEENEIDNELKENMLIGESIDEPWGWDHLSKIFHIGTQNIPLSHSTDSQEAYINDYMKYCHQVINEQPPLITEKEGQLFELPKPDLSILEKTSFLSVLSSRKTCRSFNKKPIHLDVLSVLLYLCFGEIHNGLEELEEIGLRNLGIRKSSPSAGALHPNEAYIVSLQIDNLPLGIYHYRSDQHVLTKISDENIHGLMGTLLCGQHFSADLSVGIFICCRFEKSWHKYKHSLAYRTVLLDIGHLSQTFQLVSTALGLHPWLTAMLRDTEINKLLKINETNEHVMFFVGAGKGNGSCLDEVTKKMVKDNRF
jgi:SagB-type dehydrogenase family enzyme